MKIDVYPGDVFRGQFWATVLSPTVEELQRERAEPMESGGTSEENLVGAVPIRGR
jgi:hypothetical protein